MNPVTVVVIFIATVGSLACPEGQYYSKFLGTCHGCGENPELTCENQEEPEACKDSCVKALNVTERTPNVTERTPSVTERTPSEPESTPEQPGGNNRTTHNDTELPKKTAETGSKPDGVTGGTNPTMLAGILSAAVALVLVPIVTLALHFHRRNRNNQNHPIAIENEHVEMENMQGIHEDNQQVPPPSPTETDDDRQYNGPETLFDLNKDERGSVFNLDETTV